ncbi:MAG: DNA repair protein RecO [Planctomycetes bacterium]|nr:DNA repair protein RecO [Planctomycetota bacterium]
MAQGRVSAEALVIRTVDFSETSRVVTLFSRERGRVGILAKGARRERSPFLGSLELATCVRVCYIPSPRMGLGTLTACDVTEAHRGLGRSLDRYYGACVVLEVLRGLEADEDPSPGLYDAARAALGDLSEGRPAAVALLAFLARAVRAAGFEPRLDACAHCGGALDGGEDLAYSALAGGMVCPPCEPTDVGVVRVARGAIPVLASLGGGVRRLERVRVPGRLRVDLGRLLSTHLVHVTEREFRMRPYLERILAEGGEAGKGPRC